MDEIITTLAVGHVTNDRFNNDILPGGCAYYAARTWQALGARSRLVSAVGEDFVCEDAWTGIDARVLRGGKTTVFTNLYPRSGPRVQFVEALAPPVVPSCLSRDWRKVDVLFLGPVLNEVDILAWKRATEAHMVAIGVQGYIRAADTEDEQGRRRVVPRRWLPSREELQGVGVACLSDEDLIGQEDLLRRLCDSVPIVALTHERKGCDIIEKNRKTWVGIHPAKEVDPTGAGDTFAAGFLFGLAQGQDPADAARLGAACASIIVEGVGGASFERMLEAFERVRRIGGSRP